MYNLVKKIIGKFIPNPNNEKFDQQSLSDYQPIINASLLVCENTMG